MEFRHHLCISHVSSDDDLSGPKHVVFNVIFQHPAALYTPNLGVVCVV
jgi:hypothetical protein